MFARIILCAVVVAVAVGNYEANNFMDNVLKQVSQMIAQADLEPVEVPHFLLRVRINGTDHEVIANHTQGSIFGFREIERSGNCAYEVGLRRHQLRCNVTSDALRFLVNFEVEGDSSSGKHNISTTTEALNYNLAQITIRGPRALGAKYVEVKTYPMSFSTSVSQGELNLDRERFGNFTDKLAVELNTELQWMLQGSYAEFLGEVVKNFSLP